MYGNVNTVAAFELDITDGDNPLDVSTGTKSNVDLSIPGAKKNTCFCEGLMLVGDGVSSITGLPGFYTYIPTDGTLRVVVSAPGAGVSIPAGVKVRGSIKICDNNFNSDLL